MDSRSHSNETQQPDRGQDQDEYQDQVQNLHQFQSRNDVQDQYQNELQDRYQYENNEAREFVSQKDLDSSTERESSFAMPEWRVLLPPKEVDPGMESEEGSDHRESFARKARRRSNRASRTAMSALNVLLAPPQERSTPLLLVPFPSEVFPIEYIERLPEWRFRAGNSVIREHWRNWEEFQMAAIGTAVGLKKIVKFPMLAAKYGQGTFICAFIIVEFLIGFPLLFLEMSLGQFTAKDPVRVLALVPLAEGMRFAIVIVAVASIIYINIYLSYVFHVLCSVFNSIELKSQNSWPMPWGHCEISNKQAKHLVSCKHVKPSLANNTDFLCIAHFYMQLVTDIQEHHDKCSYSEYSDVQRMQWPLLGCLLSISIMTYVFIFNGIKTIGRSVFVMIPLMCVLMLVCLIAAMCQDGAMDGIAFLLKPDYTYLINFEMWSLVIVSVVESLNLGTGAMLVVGSYATYESSPHYHAFFVCLADAVTSLVVVCMIAGCIGITANEYQVPIRDIVSDHLYDASLETFIFITTFITKTWCSPIWAISIFSLLFCVGETYKFGSLLVMMKPIYDTYPILNTRRPIFALVVVILLYVITLPFLQSEWSAYYVSKLSSAGPMRWLAVFLLTLFAVTFVYAYGINRLRQDFNYMTHFLPNRFFCTVWIVAPCVFLLVMIADLAAFPSRYKDWPPWLFFFIIVLPIPIIATWNVTRYHRKGQLGMVLHPRDEVKWSRVTVVAEEGDSVELGPSKPAAMALRTVRPSCDGKRHVEFVEHLVTVIPPSSLSIITVQLSETSLLNDSSSFVDEEASSSDTSPTSDDAYSRAVATTDSDVPILHRLPRNSVVYIRRSDLPPQAPK